ncbi:MAG: PAS domain S-box protein [Calditrichaeota bacterium]|nr:PAS domain S-box protein [Calditrichota bacterium]
MMASEKENAGKRVAASAFESFFGITPHSEKFAFEKLDLSHIRDFSSLRIHDHICHIYENFQQRDSTLASFIISGLRNGEKTIIFCDEEILGAAKQQLSAQNFAIEQFVKSGQFQQITDAEFYEHEGEFSPDQMLNSLGEQCKQAKSEGYPALRVICDLATVTRNISGEDKILEYENKMDGQFLPENDCINICMYNRKSFSAELVKNLFAMHPFMVKGGHICQNFYYSPTESDTIDRQIDHLFENLERFHLDQSHALHNSAMLWATLNSISDGISILSPDLTVQKVNSSMNKWYQENLPLEGKKCYNAYHGITVPCDPCPTLLCMESGKTEHNVVPGLPGSPVEWIELYSHPIKDPMTGEIVGVAEFVKDITEQKRAEFALKISEEKYRTTLMSIGDGVIVTDIQGKIVNMNKEAEKLIGWTESDALGHHLSAVFKIINEDSRRDIGSPVERVLREGVVVGLANHTLLIAKDGSEIPIADSGAPVRDGAGNITGVVLVFRDQSRERQAQKEIKKARQFAESILETIHEPLIVLDPQFRIISANRAFYETFGETPQQANGKSIFDLRDGHWDIPELRALLEKILPQNTSFKNFEVKFDLPKLGEHVKILNARRIYQRKEKTEMILLAVNDITEQKNREKEISKHLKERDVLLSEIHHRVKNNLNLVVSLLNLQARKIQNKDQAIEAFINSRDRIYTMALVHEKLYQSAQFSAVNMKQYIQDLLQQLSAIYDLDSRIHIHFFGEEIYLDMDRAIPCALILNELITNAIKHAFPDGKSGDIIVRLKKADNERIVIICRDNGIGLPLTNSIDNSASLGLQLVKILTEQLEGKLTIKREQGTQFEISFPGEKK